MGAQPKVPGLGVRPDMLELPLQDDPPIAGANKLLSEIAKSLRTLQQRPLKGRIQHFLTGFDGFGKSSMRAPHLFESCKGDAERRRHLKIRGA